MILYIKSSINCLYGFIGCKYIEWVGFVFCYFDMKFIFDKLNNLWGFSKSDVYLRVGIKL